MSEHIEEQAWKWHQALQADSGDWDGFTHWLEADPRHRDAYDSIALLDADIHQQRRTLAALLPAEPPEPAVQPRRTVLAWAGGGIAAALALLVSVPLMKPDSVPTADYRTGSGEIRTIALMDGSRIALGPSSHLSVAGKDQDQIAIVGGAYFDITHDPDRPLTIRAGDQRIVDIGTRFDILAVNSHTQVTVAEGRVSVLSPGKAESIELAAGRRLAIDNRTHSAQVSSVSAEDVGSWRDGRLVYVDAPLSLVAADIGRYAGKRVEATPAVAGRRFSGVLVIGDGSALVRDVQQVMGLAAKVEGDRVRLDAR